MRVDRQESRNPLIAHLRTIGDLIREMGLPEEEEERRLNELQELGQNLFSQPVNSKVEEEIIRQIDRLATDPYEERKVLQVKPEADEILAEFQEAQRAIFRYYGSVGEVLDKLAKLRELKQQFFSCAAGSEEERKIREEVRKITRGE